MDTPDYISLFLPITTPSVVLAWSDLGLSELFRLLL